MRRSDVAHRVEVLGELEAVAGPEGAAEGVGLAGDEVEDAAVLPQAGEPRLDVGAVGGPEQPFEDGARVVLHRERGGRGAPRDGVDVGATVALVAGSEDLDRVDGELERRELGLLPERARRDLVHRGAGLDVGPLGLLDVHAGQPRRRGAGVVADALALARDGDLVGEAAQHVDVLAHRGEGLEDGGELERAGRARRRPRAHLDAVGDVDRAEAADRGGRGVPGRGEGRHHAVEERQRERGAEAAEHGAAGQCLLRDHRHGSGSLSRRSYMRLRRRSRRCRESDPTAVRAVLGPDASVRPSPPAARPVRRRPRPEAALPGNRRPPPVRCVGAPPETVPFSRRTSTARGRRLLPAPAAVGTARSRRRPE